MKHKNGNRYRIEMEARIGVDEIPVKDDPEHYKLHIFPSGQETSIGYFWVGDEFLDGLERILPPPKPDEYWFCWYKEDVAVLYYSKHYPHWRWSPNSPYCVSDQEDARPICLAIEDPEYQ